MSGKPALVDSAPTAAADDRQVALVAPRRHPKDGRNGFSANPDVVLALAIATALRRRSAELACAIYAGVLRAVPSPPADGNRSYRDALRDAIAATVGYAIEVIERQTPSGCEPPWDALAFARRSAREGVSLGVVRRRFAATGALLGGYVQEELDRLAAPGERREPSLVRAAADAAVESVSDAVAGEYDLAYEELRRTPEGRVSEVVRRLLAGDGFGPEQAAELGYEIDDSWHLGLIAAGGNGKDGIRRLSMALGCELLTVRRSPTVNWVWLGTSAPLVIDDVEELLAAEHFEELRIAIGEPGRATDGWRLTHRQATAAMRLGLRLGKRLTRYAEDPLLAAGLQDDVLARSLKEIYLAPLGVAADRKGASLRETLRAYFQSRCNAASAAAVLNVDRHTVERRLRTVEALLGTTPQACQAELTIAMRLEELERPAGHPG